MMKLLKVKYKLALVAVFLAAASCSFTSKQFDDPDKDKTLVDLISYVLQKWHFSPNDMDDAFSKNVYDTFIDSLDPLKRYFSASDINEFAAYETLIDDQLKEKDLTFFNTVFDRFSKRKEEAKKIYKEVLDTSFNYTEDESINVDYDTMGYTDSKKELKERWRKQLKFSTISNYYDLVEDQKTGKENDPDFKELSAKELEEKSRETTLTSLDEYFTFIDDLERKDYFAQFLNTVVEQYDPHTNYFAPPDRDRFDLRMSGKLEGIGARLQKKNDYITIVEVISGGPVWRGEHMEVGDAITKVKQEDEDEAVSVVGMRMDDAIQLIKGPKGTKVTLTIKRVDGTIDEEIITRDVVEIDETYAKSAVIDKDEVVYGLVNLPQFYFDMDDYNKRNAASDVKDEILRLKEEGMQGLVLDLRDNGGGSLRTAIDIAGLFIKDGPVVQVASSGGNREVLKDDDESIVWDGPLVILVNELSASASEILAAAMQDYKRGIVIGSKQSYGKGTVQNVVDLNQWMRNSDMGDIGALKITTQKFYRVNGGSTQLEGVKSDVVMPDRYSYIEIGERDYDNPLPYTKIEPAKYTLFDGYIDFEKAIENSKARIAQSEQLALIDANAKWIKERRDENEVTLNFEKYIAEIEQNKKEGEKFEAIDEYDNKLSYRSVPSEMELIKQDTILGEKRKRWHKSLSRDVYVEEAVNVLQDLQLNNINKSKLSQIKN